MEKKKRILATLAVVLVFISTSATFSFAGHGARRRHVRPLLSFGPVNVGTAAPVQTLTYTFSGSATLSAVTILTNGASGLDYTDGRSSTCVSGTAYNSGDSCNVTVAFTPSAPGLRSGAVSLYAQGSNLPLNIWYLNGVGQSSAVTIDPGTQSALATLANSGQASGTALDGAGNVYVVDNANSQVFELAAGSFSSSTIVSSGLSSPTAIALDGAGNLYISDTGNNRIVEVPNEQGTLNSGDLSVLSVSGLGTPSGLAVDGNGNLYVADSANGNVYQIQPSGAGQTTVVSGLSSPAGLALDSAANVYISGNNQVNEYPSGGGGPIAIGTGFSNPGGLAVDASGAVYVADSGNNRIVLVAPGGATQVTLPFTGISNPQALAIDSAANMYVTAGTSAYKINRSLATLAFPSTEYGAASAAQTVTLTNAGNAALGATNLAVSANFTQVPSGGTDCAASTNLASGLQCLVAVEFTPLATGALAGTATLTDNALNNPAATQSVALSGTATDANSSVSVTLTNGSNPSTYGQSLTFTATITSDTGLLKHRHSHMKPLAFSGNVAWSANTGCAASPVSGYPAMATCTTASLTAGSDTVTATYAGDANHTGASGSAGQTVNKAPVAVTLGSLTQTYTGTPLSPTVTTTPSGLSYSLTGAPDTNAGSYSVTATITDPNHSGSASGTFVIKQATATVALTKLTQSYTGSPLSPTVTTTPAGLSYSLTGAPDTNPGRYPVTATITDPNHTAGTASGNFVINKAAQTITVTTAAPPTATNGSVFTIVANASSGLPLTYSSGGACANSGATYTITASSGTCTVELTQPGNTFYSTATPVVETTTAAKAVKPKVSLTGLSGKTAEGAFVTVTASSNETGFSVSIPTITTSTPSVCSVSGQTTNGTSVSATVTILATSGACDVTATWAANYVYAAATLTKHTTAVK